ncbi:MAG: TonB-dependent receptor [Pelodictyon luteolum]|uniref:TonB-dependent receptor n=1 Tax=Pelodictyon luteolum TaxID=1100 RepID=A0A165L0T5_PELLU|nr:TonB-dependent receptor [Pelodictyon luteolum]KZK73430.1 MAG: TonB-dependent receptor [Pelodictyon luteolum]
MKSTKTRVRSFTRIVATAWCMLAFLVPLTSYGADTGTVKGQVTDRADGEGVYGATVTIGGTTISTATDMDGNFTLRNVPAATQKLSVSIVGYAPASQVVTVGADATATANISLGQTTIMASEVVVGAAMYSQDRLDVPVTVNVINKETIKEEPNPTLDGLIESVPGVVVSRAGGQTASQVQIRGSNTYQGGGIATRVNAFYDGFPINAPQSNEIVWQTASMNSVDNIEVLKGSAATLYGSAAMGGVVSVTGHLADKEEILAGSSMGFYDAPPSGDQSTYRESYTPIFWSSYFGYGNKQGKWRYSLMYTHSDDNGYRENNGYYLNDFKLKARYDIDATQYLQISSIYNDTEGGYQYQWPDAAHAYDTYSAKYAVARTYRTNALAGLNYVKLFDDNISLDTRTYYTFNSTRNEYPTTSTFNRTYADRGGIGTKLDWRLNDDHRLLVGVDANLVKVTSSLLFTTNSSYDDEQEQNFASFIQDEWKITNKLTALGSVRYDWSGINADAVSYNAITSVFTPTTPTTSQIKNKSVDAISPRVALNYKATEKMSLRGSWGQSFRAPSIYERFVTDAGGYGAVYPNGDLNKETMTAYELGVFNQISDNISVDVVGFINDYKDMIESVQIGTYTYYGGTTSPIYQYKNIPKARIWGIETNLNVRPVDEVNVNLAYTYMNAKHQSLGSMYTPGSLMYNINYANPDPEWLPYRPEHMASASVNWKATKDLALNVNGRYLSKYKNISSETNVAGINYPGNYVVFNLGTKYQFTQSVSGTLACNNLFNEQYEEIVNFRAPGRSYVLGVDFSY